MENHLDVLVSVYRSAPFDPPTSCPFRLAGVFRRLDLSKLTGSWTRHRSPFARKLGPVPPFHGHCFQANAADTINGIELTVPPYITSEVRPNTLCFSFYHVIEHPTDMQAKRGASMAVQTLDPK
jgi:hypothetical protein